MAGEQERQKLCFVVGPIGEADSDTRNHADWLLEGIIRPVMVEIGGFDVIRADQIAQPGMIDAQVIEHLLDADLVIADLSNGNANAFYEIGIRHMIEKPIIHMQLANEKIPFDVSLYRATRFARAYPKDLSKAKQELKRAVEAILAPDYRVDNPVTRTRGQIKLEESATPEQLVVLEQLRAVQERLDRIERSAFSSRRSLALSENVQTDMPLGLLSSPSDGTTFYVHFTKKPDKSTRSKVRSILKAILPATELNDYSDSIEFTLPNYLLGTEPWHALVSHISSIEGVKEVSEIPF